MIYRLLFERPWLLSAVLVGVQFMLIVIWSMLRTRATARLVWMGFAVMPVLLLTSYLVVTPTEQIIARCRQVAKYVETGDVDAIAQALSENFRAGGWDREEFIRRLYRGLTRFRVDKPRLRQFRVELPSEDRGVAEFDAASRLRADDIFVDWVQSRWRVRLHRQGGVWMVTEIEALPRPYSPLRNMGEWLR